MNTSLNNLFDMVNAMAYTPIANPYHQERKKYALSKDERKRRKNNKLAKKSRTKNRTK